MHFLPDFFLVACEIDTLKNGEGVELIVYIIQP